MNSTAERTISFWAGDTPPEAAPPLGADATADIVVVGAGIAGLSTAYLLAREGHRVVVLDSGRIGGGMTAQPPPPPPAALAARGFDLVRRRGLGAARLAAASHSAAIDRIEEIQLAERIDCDFARLDGYL